MESIRQMQVASTIKQQLSDVFIRNGRDFYGNAFVTITNVRVTSDLMTARIYLSVFNVKEKDSLITVMDENNWAIRKMLAAKIRNKVRKIPELEFYLDDTLDEVEKIDRLLDKIKEEDQNRVND
ncbi:MAG: 30S ribosome-binding factor RbfA [Chitinophagales bacterium]